MTATSELPSTVVPMARWWSSVRADAAQAWSLPLVRQGAVGTLAITVGSFTPAFLPPDSHVLDSLGMAWMGSALWRSLATVLILVGVAMLLEAWLRLRPTASGARAPVATWAIWSLPLLAAPPLFSRDAYSYAAQGHMVAMSWDPYSVGPFYAPGGFMDQVDPMWIFTPAPYGPLALQAQHLVVAVTRDDAYLAAVGMRVWGVLSVALIAYALPRLAERVGVSRDHATWLGVLNPLVILHLVGGAHNDAVMIALSVYALLLAARGRLLFAIVTVAAAAAFKQTGVLTLIGIAGLYLQHRQHRPATQRQYLLTLAKSGGGALAVFAVLTQVSGLGWGWIPNLSVPISLRSLLAPPTFVGSALELVMTVFGLPQEWREIPLHAVQGLAMLVGVAAIGYFAWRFGRTRPMVAVSGSFLALCLCSPVLHPWYMLWGGVLLGATRVSERVVRPAIWVTMFLVAYSAIDAAVANGLLALGLSAVAGVFWRMRSRNRETAADDTTLIAGRIAEPSTTAHAERNFLRVN